MGVSRGHAPPQGVATGGAASIPAGTPQTLKLNFTFATVSPANLGSIAAGDVVERAEITITTAFDDAAATLEVGSVADPDQFLAAAENDPAMLGTYGADNNHEFAVAETARLTITPGASTQGAGFALLHIRRV